MRRTLRWALIGGAALAVVLVGLVLAPFLMPIDRLRPLVVRVLEEYTGRAVEVGALRLHLLPTVHVEVADLRVKNPAGFPPGETLSIKAVDIGTTAASLLARRLDVTGVTFNGVQLNVLQAAEGRTNYAIPGGPGALVGTTRAGGQAAQGAPAVSLSRVDSVTALNVTINASAYDARTGRFAPLFSVAGLNARVRNIRLNEPGWTDSVTTTSDLRGVTFSSPFLTEPVQVQKGTISVTAGTIHATLTAALGALRADAAVTVVNLKDPVADVDVTIPDVDVVRLQAMMTGRGAGAAPMPGSGGPRRLLARGRIRIGRVVAPSIDASAVAGQIVVYTDAAELRAYSFSALGGTVRGTGAVDYGTVGPRVQTALEARGLDLAGLMKALALPVQPGIGGKVEADVRLATALRRDPLSAMAAAGRFALRDGRVPGVTKPLQVEDGTFSIEHGSAHAALIASLDAIRGQGVVTVANLKKPLLDFDLTVPEVDLHRAAALFTTGNGGPGRAGGRRQLVAKGVLKIGRLLAQPLETSAVTCRMAVYTDEVTVDSYRLSAYGGTASGTAALQYGAARAPAQGTVQLSGVDVGRLEAAFAGGGARITGTLEASGRITTMLTPDPLAALAGAGTFAVRNGSFPGLDLQQRFAGMAKVVPGGVSGITRFAYLGGDFRIAQKRVSSNVLKLASDNLQATAGGSAGFDQTLSYHGTGTLKGTAVTNMQGQLGSLPFIGEMLGEHGAALQSLGRYTAEVPFVLTGRFGSPQFSLAGIPRISVATQPGEQPRTPPGLPSIKLPPLPFHL